MEVRLALLKNLLEDLPKKVFAIILKAWWQILRNVTWYVELQNRYKFN